MGKIFSSHCSPSHYSEKPKNIHGQAPLQQLEQYRSRSAKHVDLLDQIPCSRVQDQHLSDTAWTPSNTSKKAIAIFFMTLFAMSEGIHVINSRATRTLEGPRKNAADSTHTKTKALEIALQDIAPPLSNTWHETALVRTVQSYAPTKNSAHWERIGQLIETGTQVLGTMAFPFLAPMFMSRPVKALEMRSFTERAERSSKALQEAAHATSGTPLFYGKFDAAAEGFEKAADTYSNFHEEHPILAEFALSAATASAKGLACAAQAATAGAALGGIVGAPFGPVAALAGAANGALYLASRGFLVCAQAAIAQDALGRGIHAIAGEQLDAFMGSAIDTMTPYFEKIDPRLTETGRGRMFSAGLLFGVGSAADIKLGTSGLLKAVHKGHLSLNDMADAFVRGGLLTAAEVAETIAATAEHGIPGSLQEIAFHRALNLGSQALAHPDQTEFSFDPTHDLGAPGNYFQQPGTREALFQKFTTESNELLKKPINNLMQEGIQTNEKLKELAKHPDQVFAAQERQKIFEHIRSNEETYQLTKNTIEDATSLTSSILTISGKHELANRLMNGVQGAIKIVEGFKQIAAIASSASSMTQGAVAAAPLACMGPWGMVAAGIVMIISALSSQGSDGMQELSQQIEQVDQHVALVDQHVQQGFETTFQMILALARQSSEIYVQTMKEFGYVHGGIADLKEGVKEVKAETIEIKKHINVMHDNLIRGFLTLRQETQSSALFNAYSFDSIGRHLQELHVIKSEVDAVLLHPCQSASTAVESRQARYTNQKISMSEFKALVEPLEDALLGGASLHKYLNGYLFDVDAMTKNRIFTSALPEALLGYLSRISDWTDSTPDTLPNLEVFVTVLNQYLNLLQIGKHLSYDVNRVQLQKVRNVCVQIIAFIESIETNRALFEKLLVKEYKADFEALKVTISMIVDDRIVKLADTVHGNAIEVIRREIDTFPAYQELPPPQSYSFSPILEPVPPRDPPAPPPSSAIEWFRWPDGRYRAYVWWFWNMDGYAAKDNLRCPDRIDVGSAQEMWDWVLSHYPSFPMSRGSPSGGQAWTNRCNEDVANFRMTWNNQERARVAGQYTHKAEAEASRVAIYNDKQQDLWKEHNRTYKQLHADLKSGLQTVMESLSSDQSKSQFRFHLDQPENILLAGLDKTIVNPIAMPLSEQTANFQVIPLDVRRISAYPEIEKLLPPKVILAERLNLGMILFLYSTTSDETISLRIGFKENDCTVHILGTVNLKGTCTNPQASRTVHLQHSEGDSSFDVTLPTEFPYALSSLRLQSIWENAQIEGQLPNIEVSTSLSAKIDSRLRDLRYVTGPTETRVQEALETVNADYHQLLAFATVAGASEAEKQELSGLLNKESIVQYQEQYSAQDVAEGKPFLPQQTEEDFTRISSHFLSRFASKPTTSSSFSEPLRRLMFRLDTFAIEHQEAMQQPKEAKPSEETKKTQPSSSSASASSSESMESLRQEIQALREDQRRLYALLEQKFGLMKIE